jgi:hypothetical protein
MSHPTEPEPTRLESADEIVKAVAARKARTKAGPNGPSAKAPARRAARRERPTQRPPMAMLCILDDGKQQDGEWARLRAERTLIGRTDGEVRIPHDVQMSARHAEVVREQTTTGWRWLLVDVGSTNGTFVRIGNTVLRNGNELIIGQGRYRFESGLAAPAKGTAAAETSGVTQIPQSAVGLVPALVEITPAGPGQRFGLSQPEYWFGSDPQTATLVRGDDHFVDAQHARFFRDKSGQWHVANNASVNGLWLRIKTIALDKACQFRLGEQRFLFRVGAS